MVPVNRSTLRYHSRRPDDSAHPQAIVRIAEQRPRFGYRRIHWVLGREGIQVNRRRVQRIYREEQLQVRRRRRKRVVRRVIRPLAVPSRLNERWSMDFMSDQVAGGRRLRILNIVDDYSRESVGLKVAFSIGGQDLTELLDEIVAERGLPGTLLEELFLGLEDARRKIGSWRQQYNEHRPHGSLGMLSPREFAARSGTLQSPEAHQEQERSPRAPSAPLSGELEQVRARAGVQ